MAAKRTQTKKGARKAAPRRPAARSAAPSKPKEHRAAVPGGSPARKAVRILRARRQPESLRLRSAGPSFTVKDLQASLDFYRDVLGFVAGERWEQDGVLLGVELVAGRVRFWIGQDDWKKGRDRVKGQGFRIYCGTTQDIDALAARIDSRGGRLTEGPKSQPWGRELTVTDPDGFVITFSNGM
jgi:catechol 2,3-dioxygenase-like lactoylglutathione lyase family enzyme